ncbi:paraneoplastic antigen-like protein 8A [Ctenodactylus gundi]
MLEARAMNLLEDWCRGMEVDIRRSLLVTGIPEDCGHAEIEETLDGVLSPLGTYRVLNKIFLREENVKAALVEVSEGVNLSTVPREFPGRGGLWRVACRDPTHDAEFLKNLHEFLDAEGRTWEDVVRLLQLSHPAPSTDQSQPAESWAEALGVLLGAVMRIVFCMDAEIRNREEAGAQEAMEAEPAAKKVKTETGLPAEVRPALEMENAGPWGDPKDLTDPPKPLVHRVGAKTGARRRKQKKNPKQEPGLWERLTGGHSCSLAFLEDPRAGDAESVESTETLWSHRKPCVKQEDLASKKLLAQCSWKVNRDPSPDTWVGAGSPGDASESDQDGGQERPLKKKVVGWASGESPLPTRKKKKASLGLVSYDLVDSEGARKKPVMPKKGLSSRRGVLARKGPRGLQPPASPALASRAPKAKAGGAPRASNGEKDSM